MRKKIKDRKRRAALKTRPKKKITRRTRRTRARKFIGEAIPAEAQRHKVDEAKYYRRPGAYMPPREWEKEELPSRYGDNRIVILARDPYWLHVYWEIAEDRKRDIEREAQSRWDDLRKVLRVYDVTDVAFDGTNANRSFDIGLTSDTNNWYVHLEEPNRSWCVDLGAITSDGKFILIMRSNVVSTPLDRPSDVSDEEWMALEEEFVKLYGISGNFGISSSHMAPSKRSRR